MRWGVAPDASYHEVTLPWGRVAEHADALLIPPLLERKLARRTYPVGLFDGDGAPIQTSTLANFKSRFAPLDAPLEGSREAAETLPGRWLFGGLLRPQFGHILTNALGRIWAVDDALDGAVFFPDRQRTPSCTLYPAMAEALHLPGTHRVAHGPLRVEPLVVAPDLFSEALDCQPAQSYRDWWRDRMGGRSGRRRLYLSRRALSESHGRVLCEDVLEENLARAGYEIIAPELLSLTDQVALYRDAAQIISTDNSALHLLAFAAPPDAELTVIQRRPGVPENLRNHLVAFFGDRVRFIDVLRHTWFAETDKHQMMHAAKTELDYAALGAELMEAGAVSSETDWKVPSPDEVGESLQAAGRPGARYVARAPGDSTAKTAPAMSRRDAGREQALATEHDEVETLSPQGAPEIAGMRYLRVISELHGLLEPRWYLEIGTNKGRSLERANCNFVAVDPDFILEKPIKPVAAEEMFYFQKTSDAFFASGFCEQFGIEFDLAFLDGLQQYEFLLRDFMKAEKLMTPSGTVLLHDCCPTSVEMTARKQTRGNWTGDVWKTLLILQRFRPDLEIMVTTARPTGLVIIRGLDPANTVLDEAYDEITAEFDGLEMAALPGGISGYYEQIDLISPRTALARIAEARAG